MNLLLHELLKIKAHIGKKNWNAKTSLYIEGLRSSQRLLGNPSLKRLSLSKNKVFSQNSKRPLTLKSFQRVKSLKKRSYFVVFNLEKTLLYLSQSILFIQKLIQQSENKGSLNSLHILIVSGKLSDSSGNFYLDLFRSINPRGSKLSFNHDSTETQNTILNRSSNHISSKVKLSILQNQWVGGMLTNWKQVCESLRIYSKFKNKFENFLNKHNIQFSTYEKYKKKYSGLTPLANTLPDLIIITNPEKNDILIKEAFLQKIPMIALVNSQTSPSLLTKIQYPIPGNNTSPYFIYFCVNLFLLAMQSKTFKKT